jgi:EAL domain-containing protein (putative c-di-GMP-specific phosphodiesterase class I)
MIEPVTAGLTPGPEARGPEARGPEASGPEARGQDILVRDHLHGFGRNRRDAYAAQIHLSRFRPVASQSRSVGIALRPLAALAARDGGALFRLSNADLVLVCRGIPLIDMDAAVSRVRRLFRGEVTAEAAAGRFDDPLVTWFDLSKPGDYAALLATAEAISTETARHAPNKPGKASAKDTRRPLDPLNLSAIGRKLREIRIPDLIRQQTAIEIRPGGDGKPLFRETYVSMSELQNRIAPEVNLLEGTSLFRYLTETLDKHVLATVPRRGLARGRDPISLNLNISSLTSGEFHLFHKEQNGAAGRAVIEIQLIDILADMEAFAAARDTLQGHGYRVLVDGLSPLTLEFFDVSHLRADFVKICWSREAWEGLSSNRTADIRKVVARTGTQRTLLARVDCDDAIKWALELGITRFQGRYIDKVIKAMTAKGSF